MAVTAGPPPLLHIGQHRHGSAVPRQRKAAGTVAILHRPAENSGRMPRSFPGRGAACRRSSDPVQPRCTHPTRKGAESPARQRANRPGAAPKFCKEIRRQQRSYPRAPPFGPPRPGPLGPLPRGPPLRGPAVAGPLRPGPEDLNPGLNPPLRGPLPSALPPSGRGAPRAPKLFPPGRASPRSGRAENPLPAARAGRSPSAR